VPINPNMVITRSSESMVSMSDATHPVMPNVVESTPKLKVMPRVSKATLHPRPILETVFMVEDIKGLPTPKQIVPLWSALSLPVSVAYSGAASKTSYRRASIRHVWVTSDDLRIVEAARHSPTTILPHFTDGRVD